MATFLPLLAMRPCGLRYGGIESSKLSAINYYVCGSRLRYRSEDLNIDKELAFGDKMKSGPETSLRRQHLKLLATSRISINQTEERLGVGTEVGVLEKVAKYLFRTELGGLVKVAVGRKNMRYIVHIEVSSMELHGITDELLLVWSLDSRNKINETPFWQKSFGNFVLEMEFEARENPFKLSFILKDFPNREIKSHRKTDFCVPVGFTSGKASPLGISFPKDGAVNFAFFSRNAESVILCLYDDSTNNKPVLEIDLDPYVNRTGHIWHASIESMKSYSSYGYQCKMAESEDDSDASDSQQVLLDPYAKVIKHLSPRADFHGAGSNFLGQLSKESAFDWSGDIPPNLPTEKLLLYRLNVGRFTVDKSSNVSADVAGSFAGVAEKLHHFVDLGINAVLLEPIFPSNELEGHYFPRHFFSPLSTYGSYNSSVAAINSMKEMVKRFHANGVEVLLEVVFTHTATSGAMQGIDDSSYYYVDKESETTSSLSCNCPIVRQLIIDSLRHWVIQFHVDGFCFINASSLMRGPHGESLSRSPLVEAIVFDPLLSKTKIIADFWDPRDMATKDARFPHWKRWAEMNSKFCFDIRSFLRGEGLLSNLATRLCGSGDTFSDGRGPAFSFNFISRNSGLTLVDLVSFSNDTVASEISWNCGEEGPTTKTIVLERRLKQIRNYLFVLFVSLGVPVLNMGDECGQSTGGSVAYAARKPFDWNALQTGFGIQITKFISFLTALKARRSDLLQSRNFLKVENIDWNRSNQTPPQWEDPTSKFLSMTLRADQSDVQPDSESSSSEGDLFLAFNAGDHSEKVILPPPQEGMEWVRLVDTALPFPGFFSADGEPLVEQMAGLFIYEMKSYSCTLFEAKVTEN